MAQLGFEEGIGFIPFAGTGWGAVKTSKVPGVLPSPSSKEQREYEHIKESAEKSGRYGDRAKEVAARTVLKQHKEKGQGKGE